MNIRDITKQIRVFADQLESQNAPEAEKPDPYAELKKAHAEGKVIQYNCGTSWEDVSAPVFSEGPECYRIKPESTFQLPPPPPSMQWHRTDGWQEGDLPQGMRPLVLNETSPPTDEIKRAHGWKKLDSPNDCPELPARPHTDHCRTNRPLTFTHAGKQWTWHRPGDPIPCAGLALVTTLLEDGEVGGTGIRASRYDWSQRDDGEQIIGWRYADEKKTVPLGPEDVPPGSVIQGVSSPSWHWISVVSVHQVQVKLAGHCGDIGTDKPTWEELKLAAKINRSIPLTGKWNPDAWEPCHKQIDA